MYNSLKSIACQKAVIESARNFDLSNIPMERLRILLCFVYSVVQALKSPSLPAFFTSLPCFCPLFNSILNKEMKYQRNFLSLVSDLFREFLNHFPNRIRTLLARGMNAFCTSEERFSAGDERVQNACSNCSPHTATYVATSDFQTELLSRSLLTGTHLQKQAVATLSYSPASMLHPQVISALAFSAGLNGFKMTKLI